MERNATRARSEQMGGRKTRKLNDEHEESMRSTNEQWGRGKEGGDGKGDLGRTSYRTGEKWSGYTRKLLASM
jgi:hypothetical protein